MISTTITEQGNLLELIGRPRSTIITIQPFGVKMMRQMKTVKLILQKINVRLNWESHLGEK